MSRIIVAIDGPSGAGKSTLAKRLARELGFTYLDTGAMYRALALKVLTEGIDLNSPALAPLIENTQIDLVEVNGGMRVCLDGADVTQSLRGPEVSQMASKVSALSLVREKMLRLQRELGTRGGLVAEGRDIGTVVFPGAEVKIYLDASVEERARRRFQELRAAGREVAFDETVREMKERDKRDSERDLAPLRKADDAVTIDSSSKSADEVADIAMEMIRQKMRKIKDDRSRGS